MSLPKGYLDTEALDIFAKLLNNIKQRSYDAMSIKKGHKVLDLGCGPGTDTVPLGLLVGNQGQVIGVDYDLAMLAEANQRAEQAGVSAWVKHQQTDAASLPFDSNYFDACRSDRLFQHLPNPVQSLSEMVRATKSAGRVVIVDTDWGSLSIDTDEIDIERRYARFVACSALHNGYSGRTLCRLFKQQNLTDISFEVFPVAVTRSMLIRQATQADRTEQDAVAAGVLSTEEVQRWRGSQAQADAEGVYFASVNIFLVTGRKPE
ncbi:MAG: methyltransferase domain-containing protein [Methylovulum sp.]|uniref:methyltransferase domain-containing protein n=1 Tax=Methylovulum sp. TaxID=1916980 RepID=UPI0026083AAC|nr:methyltransferase domain-containing protein [Methylovulum sp.]MDD2723198.1 methyltransferase domain-containing protein [Methylovulum sp.]MDD5123139.1 methyltransferase domain-containing protein [Methylovulum sp.]